LHRVACCNDLLIDAPHGAAYDGAVLQESLLMTSVWTQHLAEFAEFVKFGEPMAPYSYFKIGGPADALAQPRTLDELSALVNRCFQHKIPIHVLGGGTNALIRDEGVSGVVLRLIAPPFTQVTVEDKRVRAGSGASLSSLISQAARHSLAGLETLVGTLGTVGGALRHNVGDRSTEIGPYVRQVEVLDATGARHVRQRDELRFAHRWSNLDDPVILAAEFELETDTGDAIVKRMRKAWIQRKAGQPFTFQAAGQIFQNLRGLNAAALIVQAGLTGTRVGGAEISERNANYIVANPGATARDILRLIDLIKSRVRERFQIELEMDLSIW
jgi:UDP-N-acetylmuramate dehydrogenase